MILPWHVSITQKVRSQIEPNHKCCVSALALCSMREMVKAESPWRRSSVAWNCRNETRCPIDSSAMPCSWNRRDLVTGIGGKEWENLKPSIDGRLEGEADVCGRLVQHQKPRPPDECPVTLLVHLLTKGKVNVWQTWRVRAAALRRGRASRPRRPPSPSRPGRPSASPYRPAPPAGTAEMTTDPS